MDEITLLCEIALVVDGFVALFVSAEYYLAKITYDAFRVSHCIQLSANLVLKFGSNCVIITSLRYRKLTKGESILLRLPISIRPNRRTLWYADGQKPSVHQLRV